MQNKALDIKQMYSIFICYYMILYYGGDVTCIPISGPSLFLKSRRADWVMQEV